jgi:hypothetical protein
VLSALFLISVTMSGTAASAAELVGGPTITRHSQVPAIGTTIVHPRTAYGCKRIWRCDNQVCEWRRGCWGIYGYVEGPYYSVPLAKRQWKQQGLPQ